MYKLTVKDKQRIDNKQLSRRVLAKEAGIKESQARKLIEDYLAQTKPSTQTTTKSPTESEKTQHLDAKIEARLFSGMSKRSIAAVLGCSRHYVDKIEAIVKTKNNLANKQPSKPVVKSVAKPVVKSVAKPVDKKSVEVEKEPEYKWSVGQNFINIFVDGKSYTAGRDHAGFEKAAKLCIDGDIKGALALINIAKGITSYMRDSIKIERNVVTYKGLVIESGVTKRIVSSMYEGKPFEHLINFLEKLLLNPSYRAVKELYGFIEHADLEISPEGDVIAYKRVKSDYKDFYTGKFDNSVGATLKMERFLVNEDSQQTCSDGFHVAAKSYIPHYHGGSGRIVRCLVNPRDFVSIPVDYNNAKARVCEYTVLDDVTETFSV